MKKHAIIPIFIAHRGCPNDCVFCNQRKITAQEDNATPDEVRKKIEAYLPTIEGRGIEVTEVAFFGGSFTGIPMEEQSAFLEVAKEYKDRGLIDKIHLSTRPDYIDENIIANLKRYTVDVVELGIQSFDDEVLLAAGRGHDSRQAEEGCRMVRDNGFELGIQLMIGLPGDTREKAVASAMRAVELRPSLARLYPTVIIEDTRLMEMYREGSYTPLSSEEAVEITAEMYEILDAAGVTIMRVGLKSTDIISNEKGGALAGDNYHPAFRQLVESHIARKSLERQVLTLFPQIGDDSRRHEARAVFTANSRSFSNMAGHGGVNRRYFEENYGGLNISYNIDQNLANNEYVVIKY